MVTNKNLENCPSAEKNLKTLSTPDSSCFPCAYMRPVAAVLAIVGIALGAVGIIYVNIPTIVSAAVLIVIGGALFGIYFVLVNTLSGGGQSDLGDQPGEEETFPSTQLKTEANLDKDNLQSPQIQSEENLLSTNSNLPSKKPDTVNQSGKEETFPSTQLKNEANLDEDNLQSSQIQGKENLLSTNSNLPSKKSNTVNQLDKEETFPSAQLKTEANLDEDNLQSSQIQSKENLLPTNSNLPSKKPDTVNPPGEEETFPSAQLKTEDNSQPLQITGSHFTSREELRGSEEIWNDIASMDEKFDAFINACDELLTYKDQEVRFDSILSEKTPPSVLVSIERFSKTFAEIVDQCKYGSSKDFTCIDKFVKDSMMVTDFKSNGHYFPTFILKFHYLSRISNDEGNCKIYSVFQNALNKFADQNSTFLAPESGHEIEKIDTDKNSHSEASSNGPLLWMAKGLLSSHIDRYIRECIGGDCVTITQGANEMAWGDAGKQGKDDFRNLFNDPTQGPSSALMKSNFAISYIRWRLVNKKSLQPATASFKGVELDSMNVTFRLEGLSADRLSSFAQQVQAKPKKVPVLFNNFFDSTTGRVHTYVCSSAVHCKKAATNIAKEDVNHLCANFNLSQYRTLAHAARATYLREKERESPKKIVLCLTLLGAGAYENDACVHVDILTEVYQILRDTEVIILCNGYSKNDQNAWRTSFTKLTQTSENTILGAKTFTDEKSD
ncbi:MAG: hypothetical protein LBI69_01275 [Puniceicoccales bacterium]|nr:hypothetical protein [Puniceicoccales bacterium]